MNYNTANISFVANMYFKKPDAMLVQLFQFRITIVFFLCIYDASALILQFIQFCIDRGKKNSRQLQKNFNFSNALTIIQME